jgi:hypothetical protein
MAYAVISATMFCHWPRIPRVHCHTRRGMNSSLSPGDKLCSHMMESLLLFMFREVARLWGPLTELWLRRIGITRRFAPRLSFVQHQQVYTRPLNEKPRIFPERCFASALQFKAILFYGNPTAQQYIQRETLEHLAYSPGLPSSCYHIFPGLKKYVGGHRFQSDDDVKTAVKRHLSDKERNWYWQGM